MMCCRNSLFPGRPEADLKKALSLLIEWYQGGGVKSSGAWLNRPVADDNEFVARLR